jgi:hypothetical protein
MSKASKRLYFLKAPKGYGYHAGRVEEVPEAMAADFLKKGYARLATKTLPADLPGRDELMKAGYATMDEVRKIKDVTEVEGIGSAISEQIAAYLAPEKPSKKSKAKKPAAKSNK